ncbi:multicopper oxidase family protein [Micromonospora sp. DR5-3]|uniref:multicopper oxidase family protein n=1 Tax=unclassified Micromonospora TaxID=2617518 RepID=UPI0011D75443|nr:MULTISPECIES: multicopper oxidase family protein [unclassified Micromonospora]MCW3818288.1 multicopper oxidase family protein [Micromonospora sp. DR5-3]TYC21163.1 multicopper oxidase family protein [Micromonospora sp. MP36]
MRRRAILVAGGSVAGAVLLSRGAAATTTEPATSTAAHKHAHGPAGATPRKASPLSVAPFQTRMPVPPVAAPIRQTAEYDEYEVVVRPAQLELVPGLTTEALTFSGGWVGPTIRGCTGRPVKVTYRNQLDTHTNVHLHGGHVKAIDDGHPMDMILPGATRTYYYPNNQRGATLWYHDHVHGDEAEHTYRGLHGFYLIDDPAEKDLGLPTGSYEVPIMLTDVELDADGSLIWGFPTDRNNVVVNGKVKPFFPVAARKYRFRILNATNEGTYTLSLDKGQMWQIGSDGGLLPAPVARTSVTLSSGERADLVIDFTGLPIGTSVVLSDADKGPVLRFDVGFTATDRSKLPLRLRPLPALPAATKQREVHLRFDFSSEEPRPVINDQQFDPNRVDFTIKRGTTEIWTVYNDDVEAGIAHNFHLHLTQFRVLSRTGTPMTPDDAGLKDTVRVPAGTSVRLQATFTDYVGRYVYHCHFLEHSSIGMMAQMEIVP